MFNIATSFLLLTAFNINKHTNKNHFDYFADFRWDPEMVNVVYSRRRGPEKKGP